MCKRRFEILVEIGKQRIAREMINGRIPIGREGEHACDAANRARNRARADMFPVAAACERCRCKTQCEWCFRQFQADSASGEKSRDGCEQSRAPQRTVRQRFAIDDKNGETRKHEHAHHIVVVRRSEQAERQRACNAHQRNEGGGQHALRHAQALPRQQIKRHDVRTLHCAHDAHGKPWPHMRGEQIIGNIQ